MVDNKNKSENKVTSVIAREEDGNIQITFTIPFALIQKAQAETIEEMAKDIEVPGFRRGKAPRDLVKEKIPANTLLEHSLGHILPQALSDAVKEHNLKIAIYPRFELVKASDGEPWQIRGITCELPAVELGDYKKAVQGEWSAKSIVVPGQDEKGLTSEEKEQLVIKTLLNSVKIKVPKILIEEEVASRLSNLLARLEKLGLALESYLASVGKNPDSLKAEYETQAKDSIILDLALSKIAEEENLKINEKDIEQALKVAQDSNPNENPEDRKRLLTSILKRREALNFLTHLA